MKLMYCDHVSSCSVKLNSLATLLWIAVCVMGVSTSPAISAPSAVRSLPIDNLRPQLAGAKMIGRMDASKTLSPEIVLPLRNRPELDNLIKRLYDKNDTLFGHYLKPSEFADRFGPSLTDVQAVSHWAQSKGLSVQSISQNRTLIQVTGPIRTVESAFGVQVNEFIATDGRRVYAPDRGISIDPGIADKVSDVIGLENVIKAHTFLHTSISSQDVLATFANTPQVGGTGVNGFLSPSDVHSIYNIPSGTGYNGAGQRLGLFELDGFTANDITRYENQYTGGNVMVTPVSVDGFSTNPTDNNIIPEVTLDIDMELALAPSASQVVVYEGPGDTESFQTLLVDIFTKMANDDTCSVISVSYGLSEDSTSSANQMALGNIAAQMVAQGQEICVASGDSGAYCDESISTRTTCYPGSLPYVTSVGGTNLTDSNSAPETYVSETSWFDSNDTRRGSKGTGGGGGISSIWSIPYWQVPVINTSINPQASTTYRNVPDVCLYGDYNTGGYSIYLTAVGGGSSWAGYNGTSASAPLWAGFFAVVNQQRASHGEGTLGFVNTALYEEIAASDYSRDFRDIADGSTNGYYKAVKGYDNSTGLGSMIGASMIQDLTLDNWRPIDVASATDGTARMLWRRSDGAAGVWILNSSNNETMVGPTYGPVMDNVGSWTAQDLAVAPDGSSRILWVRSDGAMSVWTLDASGKETGEGNVYGPVTNWKPVDIAARNGSTRVLWTSNTGQMSVWTMDSTGNNPLAGPTYPAVTNWTALALGADSDGTARVLWSRNDGAASVWTLNASNVETLEGPTYVPASGWSANDISTADSGSSNVLWRNINGDIGLWTFNSSDVATVVGNTYTPSTTPNIPSGYTAAAMDEASNGTIRILFVRSDRAGGLWSLSDPNTVTAVGTVYGPY